MNFRNHIVTLEVFPESVVVSNQGDTSLKMYVFEKEVEVSDQPVRVAR
ncbi:hypothetical protein [Capnocytophaga canimorsus]|nr:hypothetical protein [Capnocytophaga canimorsus]